MAAILVLYPKFVCHVTDRTMEIEARESTKLEWCKIIPLACSDRSSCFRNPPGLRRFLRVDSKWGSPGGDEIKQDVVDA